LAGLNVARELRKAGLTPDVYEGNTRIGGRCYSARGHIRGGNDLIATLLSRSLGDNIRTATSRSRSRDCPAAGFASVSGATALLATLSTTGVTLALPFSVMHAAVDCNRPGFAR